MQKSMKALLQIGYWILYAMLLTVIFFVLTFFQKPPMSWVTWCRIMAGFAVIPGAMAFYVFYAFVFPYYRRTKNWFRLILFSAVVPVVAAMVGIVVLSVFVSSQFLTNDGIMGAVSVGLPVAFIAFVNGSIGFVIKGFVSWFEEVRYREELNQRNFEMELALIKSQIDPHFLFNTINNIDILIEKESVKASAYLNKLSDIMRFMLYETKGERIPLSKELTYIAKYIDLQRIRTSNANAVQFSLTGDYASKQIAPMLFIPFIENAFKHANLMEDFSVRIALKVATDRIAFECENRIRPVMQLEKTTGGMGKELIERRLTLLYPGKYQLTTECDHQIYRVKLTIQE
ncbi:sensor histidine kinase [Dyadobacter sp. CY323]|uniref:sensor histidine kinase n=1 Tax=Dyadobacter sp. CY323 TaxID=2907302 RepID=UPI001F2DAA23|nr:histidine kinase [Dyadobacter sp. CY323]MCE6991898.1 histidine kinase [Dyadobacter sp. CY323]